MDADTIGTWLGIMLAVAGFGVTWWQLWRTRSAAEAAREAILSTESRLASNQLLVLLSQLPQIELELETACASGDREAVVRSLVRWRNAGAECLGILRSDDSDGGLRASIREAVDLSAAVSSALVLRRSRSIPRATADVRVAIGRASVAAGTQLGRLQAYTEPTDE